MSPEPTPLVELLSVRVSAAERQVIVHNDCWACGRHFTQRVLHQGLRRHELHWQCDDCDVSWIAIGSGPTTATA